MKTFEVWFELGELGYFFRGTDESGDVEIGVEGEETGEDGTTDVS